jgi:hypothetical protein
MLTVVIVIVSASAGLVVALLIAVVIAIRQEPREAETSNLAPNLIAVVVRRLLGVYLRRPTPPAESHEEWPTTAWTETTGRPTGGRR